VCVCFRDRHPANSGLVFGPGVTMELLMQELGGSAVWIQALALEGMPLSSIDAAVKWRKDHEAVRQQRTAKVLASLNIAEQDQPPVVQPREAQPPVVQPREAQPPVVQPRKAQPPLVQPRPDQLHRLWENFDAESGWTSIDRAKV